MRRRHDNPSAKVLRKAKIAAFSLREAVHPADSVLPWHTHDGPTICFVLGGRFTEISAGETLECTPSTLKVVPGGERHWNRFDRGEAHGLLIEADPAGMEALGSCGAVLDRHFALEGGRPAAIARRIYEELRLMDDVAPLAIEGLMLELLAATARQERLTETKRGAPSWVLRAQDLLHSDLVRRRTLTELAAQVGVHPVTLARTFRRCFGCSVGEYLRQLRIERAAEQLGGSDLPLAAIALAAGFADQSHFSNLFRRATGMSPSAYRRAMRAG
jgi:AraC family transcriptional regulator